MDVLRALVVDDEADSLRVLGNVLESGGYQPVLASGGEEAVRVIRERPGGFGAVVLDVQMPDLSGPEVYRRARDQGVEIPVIFVTGYADDLTRRVLAGVAPEAAGDGRRAARWCPPTIGPCTCAPAPLWHRYCRTVRDALRAPSGCPT